MVIRRKDGSIYRLRGPNKLLIEQEFWLDDDEKVVIHNLDNLEKVILGTEEIVETPPPPAEEVAPPTSSTVSVEEVGVITTEPTDMPPVPTPTPPPAPKEPVMENPSRHRSETKVKLYCLPAKQTTTRDRLYDQDITRMSYQQPFSFWGTVVATGDLRMLFWSSVSVITNRSIIFSPEERRWWEVQQLDDDPSGDGFLFTCVPSRLKPDFTATT